MPTSLQKHRSRAHYAQHGRCFYCNAHIWNKNPESFMRRFGISLDQARWFQSTAEHLHARCMGGRSSAANIAAACAQCNSRRHRRKKPPEPSAYQRLVRGRVDVGKWHPAWVFKAGLIEKNGDLNIEARNELTDVVSQQHAA